jgi:putative acetyltransferase
MFGLTDTSAEARRQGVGRAIVDHLLATATVRGYRRVSLETGTMHAFAAAHALYANAGFKACGPFAGYRESPHNTFMTLELQR